MTLPGESTLAGLFGGYLLGVVLSPTEAEMRSSHLHSLHLQFFSWDVQPPEEVAASQEGEVAVSQEWRRHEHLKALSGRLPAPLRLQELREGGLLLLVYSDKTVM